MPKDAYEYARNKAHLDFLAITEHNHSEAEGRVAKKYTFDKAPIPNPDIHRLGAAIQNLDLDALVP